MRLTTLSDRIRWMTDECRRIMDGTHPMYDRQIVLSQLELIKEKCEHYGIDMKKPLCQVMEEIKAKESK